MRKTKLGAVLASLALTSGSAAVLAAAPAHADDTPTTVQLVFTDPESGARYSGWRVIYGHVVEATFTTEISDGTDTVPTVGTATLQRRLPGKTWQDQETDEDLTDGAAFTSPKAKSNAVYRVQYSGGTDGVSVWTPSTSNTVKLVTYWGFNRPKGKWHGGLAFTWSATLAPHVKHHRVEIQVKRGTWKKYKVVHTNAKSRWSVRVKGGHNRWVHYRALVAGTKQLHAAMNRAKFMVTFSRTATTHRTARVLTQR
jgi:hypothetical protein